MMNGTDTRPVTEDDISPLIARAGFYWAPEQSAIGSILRDLHEAIKSDDLAGLAAVCRAYTGRDGAPGMKRRISAGVN